MKNKYWLYLESTVFIFKDSDFILLYNSESKNKILLEKTDNLNYITNELLNINNLYCIEIDEYFLKEEAEFIQKIKNNYIGDIIPATSIKPVCIPPIVKCHEAKPEEDQTYLKETSVMVLLNEITFHLNGKCIQNCKYCSGYIKQFNCCYKGLGELDLSIVISKIEQFISTSNSIKINFTGGNLFDYSSIEELLNYMIANRYKTNLYFNYLNWVNKFFFKVRQDFFNLHIFVNFPHNENILNNLIKQFGDELNNLHFIFIVTCVDEYETAYKLVEHMKLIKHTIVPYYNNSNLDFFQNYVYTDKDDLLITAPEKRELYKKQYINTHDFGKLTILSSGKCYSNINFSSLGTIDMDLVYLVAKEWISGNVWKRIRSERPCIDCIYQYLCPSPSNYEIVINKPNLCHIKK